MKSRNLIGPQVRRLRDQRQWTQEQLTAKLQLAGFDRSRGSLAKIEARILQVKDYELFYFTQVLDVPLSALFPEIDPQDPEIYETLRYLMSRRF